MYCVYKHTNKVNNKVYIGITKQKPQDRWGANGRNYKESSRFYAAIQKYGWDNFEHEILYTELTKEQACQLEKALIKHYRSQDKQYGYNITEGGETPKMSEETKNKISNALKGNKNGLGHPCSEEKKRKISEAQKGRKLTEEHKKKLSEAAKRRHVPCSEEKKQTLSKNYPHKKKVYCKETDKVYDSVQECARQLGIHASNICKVCKGKIKTTGGYHLEYYNDTINA